MAGLVRQEADGLHYVILTREAQTPVSDIHDRMLVVLHKPQAEEWIKEKVSPLYLLQQSPPVLYKHEAEPLQHTQMDWFDIEKK